MTKETIQSTVEGSISLVYHKFTLSNTEENKDSLFCFYEGYDANYYANRIKIYYGENYLNFSCKNKKNVLKMYDKIKHHKSKRKLAFFVDKDFDDSIHNIEIYETPTYSIENLYMYESSLKSILKDVFYINENDLEFQNILNLYTQELNDYCDQITLFNAWYCSLIKKKNNEKLSSTNVCLDNKIPNKFLKLIITNISSNYDLNKIKKEYPLAILVKESEVRICELELSRKEKFQVLRGKFLIEFLIKFLEFLVEDSKSNRDYIKSNSTFHTDRKIILGQLSPHAYTPNCLISYLEGFNSIKLKVA